MFPNKFLGQNFMVDSSILRCIVDYASLGAGDSVLDAGAGMGFLTRLLSGKCKTVLAVECDVRLVEVLREQLRGVSNIEIIHGNVFKVPIPSFNKVVSIPPYHVSSQLMVWLFHRGFDCAVLVFQKEFAGRLSASVGGGDYGWLAVVAYYYVEVEVLDAVSREMFYPQPEVDSVVVRLRPKKLRPFSLKSEDLFKQLAKSLFTHRNKKVRNAVVPFVKGVCAVDEKDVVKVVEALPFRDKRVRELAPEDFGALSNVLVK